MLTRAELYERLTDALPKTTTVDQVIACVDICHAEITAQAQQARLDVQMKSMPLPVGFTLIEGGGWHVWPPGRTPVPLLHAIKFEDGSIFDSVNGWRP